MFMQIKNPFGNPKGFLNLIYNQCLGKNDYSLIIAIVPGEQCFVITVTIVRKTIIQLQFSVIDLYSKCSFASPGANHFFDYWVKYSQLNGQSVIKYCF